MVKTRTEPICINRPANGVEILHWDGRLDNRDDLRLRLRESLTGNSGDAALMLAAYGRWGIEGLVYLIGDWSAVIRDRTDGTVILASDFAGVRPLYYHVRSGQVLWSSRLQPLVERTGISELERISQPDTVPRDLFRSSRPRSLRLAAWPYDEALLDAAGG